jgi:hypothetical protein
MAYAVMTLTNGNETKQVPLGFSWTMFFWGGIPALLRQDWVWGFAVLIAGVFTSGLAGIVAAFVYNKIYAKSLFDKGYKVSALPAGYTEDHVKAYLGYNNLAMV